MTINQHSLQQQVLDDLAKDMSKSMDFEILCDVLSRFGWTVLEVEYNNDQRWVDVKNWAEDNFKDSYQEHAGTWLIENAKDATMLALWWKTK